MELNYRPPRINPPADPWDESFPGCFHPVDALLAQGANLQLDQSEHGVATNRLIPELRQAAQTMDPIQILASAGEAFFFAAKLAETFLDRRAATARATAFADLAVTGRMAYESFRLGVDEAQVKARVVELLNARDPVPAFTDMEVNTAVDLPSNGYSQSFDHLQFSPRTESTYPKDPADQSHINAPPNQPIQRTVQQRRCAPLCPAADGRRC